MDTAPSCLQPPELPNTASLEESQHCSQQLSLFQEFYAGNEIQSRLSNVCDVWDAAPKYATPRRNSTATDPAKIPSLGITFEHKGQSYHTNVFPALFKNDDGIVIAKLPTGREELVEDTLRKIAVLQSHGFVCMDKPRMGLSVRFTISWLRKELAKHGHGIKHEDLVTSLLIMSGAVVEIKLSARRVATHRAAILTSLTMVSKADFRNDPDAMCEATFHPMVTRSLAMIAYRQYDYETALSYRSSLARWLHKHLAMTWTNASLLNKRPMRLSFVNKNSGLLNHARFRDQAKALDDALEEIKASRHPILHRFERQNILEGQKIMDVEYEFYPSASFVSLTKAANARQRNAMSNKAANQ